MGTLAIRVLGTLRLERDGQPLHKFPSRRVRDLLGFLVVNRKSVHRREYLAGLFWGDLDDRRARHCLNTALWRLHRILAPAGARHAPYLRVDSQSIGFNPDSDTRIDLVEFERYCNWAEQAGPEQTERQADLYRRATLVYAGQLLPECYDDWCLIERERVENQYLRALSRLLSYHAAQGEFELAADFAQRILVQDPLREEVHRDLIDVFIAANQPAAALRQYEECERVLERELGIQPMDETKARLRSILERTQVSRTAFAINNGVSYVHDSQAPGQSIDLDQALKRLHDRIAAFDSAYADLRSAVEDFDQAARALKVAGVNGASGPEQTRAAEKLHLAARHLDSFGLPRDPLPATPGTRSISSGA